MTIREILEEMERRKPKADEIRVATDRYCLERYGIKDFSAIVERIFVGQENFGLCIGRQIPTASIELLALKAFARWFRQVGIANETFPLAFFNDSLGGRSESALKRSYYKVQFLQRGRKGLYCQTKNLLGKLGGKNLSNFILRRLQTSEGISLVDYHRQLYQEAVGVEKPVIDISPYFLEFLGSSIEARLGRPECVYVQEGDYECRLPIHALDGQPLNRPPAEWYYLFHLLMYVDGQRALLFGVGDDDRFVAMFRQNLEKVKEITGFEPSVIYIPDHVQTEHYTSEHLTEIPAWVLEDAEWLEKVQMPAPDVALFDAYASFERQLIELA